MARPSVHTFTKLLSEPFFIQCADSLRAPDGTQAATIVSIDTIRLEYRVTDDPEKWEEAIAAAGFGSLQVIDDPASGFTDDMIAGTITADRDAVPAPGDGYMIVAECTIELVPALGGAQVGKVFRRPARIVAGAVTAPAS